jgi:hypothetical protein
MLLCGSATKIAHERDGRHRHAEVEMPATIIMATHY